MSNRTLSFTVIALGLATLWAAPVQAQTSQISASEKPAAQIAEQEKVWLGVEVKSLTRVDPYNSSRRLPAGVQVIKVFEGSPAAGRLVRGDRLLAMDGRSILHAKMLFSRLAKKKPGMKVKFDVRRGSRGGIVSVKLDTRTQDNGGHTTTANSIPEPPAPSPQRQAAAEAKPEPAQAAKPEPKPATPKPVATAPKPKPAPKPQTPATQKPEPQETASANTPPAPQEPKKKPAPAQQNAPQQQAQAKPAPAPAPAQASTPPAPASAVAQAEAPAKPAPASPAPPVVVAQAETPTQPEAPAAAPKPKPQKPAAPKEPAPYSSACKGIGVNVGILPTKTKKLCLKPGGGKKSGHSFRDCPKCPEMVVIPSGSFMMGSPKTEAGSRNGKHSDNESPQHKVTIAKAFAVGKYEISFDEWEACVTDGSCPEIIKSDHAKWGRGRRPVIYVRWKATKAYLKWLSQKTGQSYRLLTEAEWEYAARAGTKTPYWWGDKIKSTQANFAYDVESNGVKKYHGEPDGIIREKTLPVGEFKPNPWGLYDVHGNVWEWVEDCWHRTYKDKPEELKKTGAAWKVGDCFNRVQRGGSWKSIRYYNRSATRAHDEFDRGYDYDAGFRIARDLKK